MPDRLRVLGVFAHPDDAELTCFGTLAALADLGAEVNLIFMSKGEGSKSPTATQRAQEARDASAVINATVDLGQFEDGAVSPTRHTFSTVEAQIREVAPTFIFTHFDRSGADDHQDHQVVGRVVLNLALRYSSASFVLQVEPPSAGSGFHPNTFIDISRYIDKKIEAVGRYESEASKFFMSEQSLRLRGSWWAHQAVLGHVAPDTYFEPFILVKATMNVRAITSLVAASLELDGALHEPAAREQ